MVRAEAHTVLAQDRACRLIESFDFLGHFLPFEHAKRFHQLKCNTARHAGHVVGRGQREQGREQFLDMRLQPEVESV